MRSQVDLRAVYDWYRSQPMPGEPQTEAVPMNCQGKFHCRVPYSDGGRFTQQARR